MQFGTLSKVWACLSLFQHGSSWRLFLSHFCQSVPGGILEQLQQVRTYVDQQSQTFISFKLPHWTLSSSPSDTDPLPPNSLLLSAPDGVIPTMAFKVLVFFVSCSATELNGCWIWYQLWHELMGYFSWKHCGINSCSCWQDSLNFTCKKALWCSCSWLTYVDLL